ncbi:MAG: hypothetical protein IIA85_02225 [Nanoarchaeota archaeon]|nr:hypothetical protein [Nanoarchaeota archaeon]
MAFKFLEERKKRKIKAEERLEDIALVERFAEKAKILIDYNPRVGYRFLKQMNKVYHEKLGGYVYGTDEKVSDAFRSYRQASI